MIQLGKISDTFFEKMSTFWKKDKTDDEFTAYFLFLKEICPIISAKWCAFIIDFAADRQDCVLSRSCLSTNLTPSDEAYVFEYIRWIWPSTMDHIMKTKEMSHHETKKCLNQKFKHEHHFTSVQTTAYVETMELVQKYREIEMDEFHKDESKFVQELQNVFDNDLNERADAAKRRKRKSAQVELNGKRTKIPVRMDLIEI